MKTKLVSLIAALCCILVSKQMSAQVQSAEGQDFWMTFLQADQDADNSLTLSLCITAKENCEVSIINPYSWYFETFQIAGNSSTFVDLYAGTAYADNARMDMSTSGKICYAVNSEQVDTCALHITSTRPISVVATNYKSKSMDATSILPVQSLGSEYVVQCYTPSSHDNVTYGTHFAIVATEDNTVVDYCLTVPTRAITDAKNMYGYLEGEGMSEEQLQFAQWQRGDTLHTPVLNKGQVYYVYTGNGQGDNYDLSGTYIMARNGKRIAVFEGNPHSNIPYQVRDRDHLYSQAYPTTSWGTKYAVTSSLTTIDGQEGYWERIDKVRIIAINDETEVRIDGELVHTFDFTQNPKHFYEFDFGAKDSLMNYSGDGHPFFEGSNHIIETSCPCAVHQFSTSNRYDHNKITGVNTKFCDGDGAMINVLPLEYLQKDVCFSPIQTALSTAHFLNIVTPTNQINNLRLDGESIADKFIPMQDDPTWSYARIAGISNATHVLSSAGGFIANVYGCGQKEAYAYSLGCTPEQSIAIPYVLINDQPAEPEICLTDKTISFYCKRDIQDADKVSQIRVDFGDDTSYSRSESAFEITHTYANSGIYTLNVYYERESGNVCAGQLASYNVLSVKVIVMDTADFHFDEPGIIYWEDLKQVKEAKYFKVNYKSPYLLTDDYVNIHFNQSAEHDGFTTESIRSGSNAFFVFVPQTAQTDVLYEMALEMNPCGTWVKIISFMFQHKKHITYLYDSKNGYVVGDTECGLNDTIHFEAFGYNNYHFVQWSDGVTDNPRSYVVTDDITFEALFAADRSGKCGDDLALNWTYNPETKTLAISGNGSLNSNYTFGVEAPTNAERLIIDEGVTSVGNSAFANYTTLKHISVAASVKTIYEQAFYNCTGLQEIYSYREKPSTAYSNTFDGIDKFDCTLHVLSASVDMYKAATGWRDFYYVQTIDAEEVTEPMTDVEVTPSENEAVVTWPTSENASTYTLVISKDGVVFCTLIFNANGQLTGIAFAPSRDGNAHRTPAAIQTSNGGLRFTVTGLSSATNYHLTLSANDADNQVIVSYASDFTTEGGTQGIEDVLGNKVQSTKISKDGQILILRGDKTYTLTGQELK